MTVDRPERARRLHPFVAAGVGLTFLIGSLVRLTAFLGQSRMFQQFPTEDGYLMLTISRNLALGNGFSVAAGTIPTNGTQPLTTFIYAVGFSMGSGDRAAGVAFALVFELVVSVIAAALIYRLSRRLFAGNPHVHAVSAVAAALWFGSGLMLIHSMNCLETGLYALMAALVALVFIENDEAPPWSWPKTLAVGVMLGLAFLVRNDACFLILAACLVHLYVGLQKGSFGPRLARTLVFGSTSVLVASPWLAFNYFEFGHIMPVSGRAESLTGEFAGNFGLMLLAVAEYSIGVVGIPSRFEESVPAIAAAGVFDLLMVAVVVRAFRAANEIQRRLIVLAAIFTASLFLFYGLFFGAGWFVPRYMFPTTPFFCILWARLVFWMAERLPSSRARGAFGGAVGTVAIALIVVMNLRVLSRGEQHQHFQVVEWVDGNVDPDVWIGAVQTGTLGFFHDRTINLDGKVNPAAFRAVASQTVPEYIVHDTPIRYLADWEGIARWVDEEPLIGQHFEVVVHEPERNLAVLRRVTPSPVDAPPAAR